MQIEDTSVLLEWTEGHPMGEGIFNHTISITEKQSNYSGDQGPIVVSPIRHCKGQLCDGPKVDGVTRQLLVTGLKPLSQYTFATVSINANGPSAASGSPEIRTKGRKLMVNDCLCLCCFVCVIVLINVHLFQLLM